MRCVNLLGLLDGETAARHLRASLENPPQTEAEIVQHQAFTAIKSYAARQALALPTIH